MSRRTRTLTLGPAPSIIFISPPHLASSKHGMDASVIMKLAPPSLQGARARLLLLTQPSSEIAVTLVMRNWTHRPQAPFIFVQPTVRRGAARRRRKEATVAHCDLLICNSDSLTTAKGNPSTFPFLVPESRYIIQVDKREL